MSLIALAVRDGQLSAVHYSPSHQKNQTYNVRDLKRLLDRKNRKG